MKNAKKSLALLLALVMILGMGTMGASAAFNDAASINSAYADAVNVMSGMGILAGSDSDGDGKFDFNPTGNVTRAQAAKMITYMILGKDAAERLPAKSMFADVKVTDWSAKFVYYLANKKIINGYGNGNFGPNDTVTATQLAKMLLAAIGYGQAEEFVGVGWDVNVFALAVELGLYDGTEAADYDTAATREEAALYVFNAMTTIPLMKYVKEDGYYDYKDAAKSTFGTAKYNYAKIEGGVITGTKDSGSGYTVLTYVKGTVSVDVYLNIDVTSALLGHKVNVIYSSKEETDSKGNKYYNAYSIEDLSKEVAMFMLPYKTIYNNIGGNRAKMLAANSGTKTAADSFSYFVNGIDNTYVLERDTGKTYAENFVTANSITNIQKSAEDPRNLCYTNATLILDKTNVIIGAKTSGYTVEEVKKVTTTAGTESITLSYSKELPNNATEDLVVEYDGIAKGDFVSVTKSGSVYVLQKCTLVENLKVTSLGGKTDMFKTLNGKYWINDQNAVYPPPTNKLDSYPALEVGGTYDVYLDKNNQYVYAEKVEDASKTVAFVSYLYFKGADVSTGTKEYYAKCVGTDGTITDYLITKTTYDAISADKTSTIYASDKTTVTGYIIDKLYTYELTTSSDYGTRSVAEFKKDSIEYNSSQAFSSNYRVTSTKTPAGNYLFADEVEFIFAKTDADTLKVKVSITKSKPSATSGPFSIYFCPTLVNSDSKTYDVDKIFVVSDPVATAGTSYIYSSQKDTYTRRSSSIGHTAPKSEGTGYDNYLYAFIDKDYLKDIKLKNTDANNAYFNAEGYLMGGFYKYTVDANGYYEIEAYDGSSDKNAVVNCKAVKGIYNGMISAGSVTDVNAEDAVIVDFSGYGVTTLSEIYDYIRDGKTVTVSFWSYLYDDYEGTDKATTTTIYINDIK